MAQGRYLVTLKDGTSIWLPEDKFEAYRNGTLDLDAPLTPEEQRDLDEKIAFGKNEILREFAERKSKK